MPPKCVLFMNFHDSVSLPSFYSLLLSSSTQQQTPLIPSSSSFSSCSPSNSPSPPAVSINHPTFGRFTFLTAPRELYGMLDAAKSADVIVAVMGKSTIDQPPFDELGYSLLSALRYQGLATVVGVCYEDSSLVAASSKQISENRKLCMRYFHSEFGQDKKFLTLTSPTSSSLASNATAVISPLLRALASTTVKQLNWRKNRGYLLASHFSTTTTQTAGNTDNSVCDVRVYGYVRGVGFSVRHPIHITDVGDFIVKEIRQESDPLDLKKGRGCGGDARPDKLRHNKLLPMEEESRVIDVMTPEILKELEEECKNLRPYDPLSSDQTWPTREELQQAELETVTGNNNNPTTAIKQKMRNNSINECCWATVEESRDVTMMLDDTTAEQQMISDEHRRREGDHTQQREDDEQGEDGDELWEGKDEEDERRKQYDEAVNSKGVSLVERSKEEMMFPDEVDTPTQGSAVDRFARYRGLRSFRTSPWDPYENLGVDCARIYEFEAYTSTQKYSKAAYASQCQQLNNGKGTYGLYVSLLIANVPISRLPPQHNNSSGCGVLVLSSVLPYEMKVSVLHLSINRIGERDQLVEGAVVTNTSNNASSGNTSSGGNGSSSSDGGYKARRKSCSVVVKGTEVVVDNNKVEDGCGVMDLEALPAAADSSITSTVWDKSSPLESKRQVEFHCGFRRFLSKPLYTQPPPTGRVSSQDKVKCLRFLREGRPAVASLYGLTLFPPGNILMTTPKKSPEDISDMLGWGSLLRSDSNRIIIKRIVLTGYPFRVHKTKAIVRYMFFRPDDIRWFKPVELHTKHGLRGHITEPLGTHGYMKCSFGDRIIQSDTVCMALYKRVFPKWYPPTWGGKEDDNPEDHTISTIRTDI
eukprot:GHVS01026883.1.p1 GENE.GHVS01026883.1~~GHVS01026883.1.p1  ORF type:complete len:957 (-),score=195.84 GHVS01026883.1:194-2800(-)